MTHLRIVFAGTPEFARASLQALVESGHVPVAVYTQPDRPAGRGRKLTASPVKQFAVANDIDVYQPATLRDDSAISELDKLRPDVLVVAAYGLILPQRVLDIPAHGCLNVHASILPRWRGAAPIQAAILAGDKTTGVSLMSMTAGLDCGPVYCHSRVRIGGRETAAELHDRLARLGGDLLIQNLDQILDGEIEPQEQDDTAATYARKIKKEDAELDWSMSADELQRRIRAYNPAPGAYWYLGDDATRIKVWRSSLAEGNGRPGEFLQFDDDAIVIACGDGALRLDELQAPGRRRGPAHEFVSQIELR